MINGGLEEMIHIKKNPNGDTRTAPKNVTYEQFQKANYMHMMDVEKVMWYLGHLVTRTGYIHDLTKKTGNLNSIKTFCPL